MRASPSRGSSVIAPMVPRTPAGVTRSVVAHKPFWSTSFFRTGSRARGLTRRDLGYCPTVANATDRWPCPQCGEPVSATAGRAEVGDQLAVSHRECPECGARIVHVVDGPADRGWRLDEGATD